jgi:hypothetical protein
MVRAKEWVENMVVDGFNVLFALLSGAVCFLVLMMLGIVCMFLAAMQHATVKKKSVTNTWLPLNDGKETGSETLVQ